MHAFKLSHAASICETTDICDRSWSPPEVPRDNGRLFSFPWATLGTREMAAPINRFLGTLLGGRTCSLLAFKPFGSQKCPLAWTPNPIPPWLRRWEARWAAEGLVPSRPQAHPGLTLSLRGSLARLGEQAFRNQAKPGVEIWLVTH